MEIVTNLNDSGVGSLRGAIGAASSGEVIMFAVTGTITLVTALDIVQDVIIVGPGSDKLTVSGDDVCIVFNVTAGVVRISGLKIINGLAEFPFTTGGGGIANQGTLTLTDVVIQDCVSDGFGGGIGQGGGIWNTSTVNVNAVSVTGCEATTVVGDGGGVWSSGTFRGRNLTVSNCVAANQGGGVWNGGTFGTTIPLAPITRGVVSNCQSTSHAGGMFNVGTMVLAEFSVSGNDAVGGNGDGIYVDFGTTLDLIRCCIGPNTEEGIFNNSGTLTIDNTTVSGHTGSGIFNSLGVMTITHSTIAVNDTGIAQVSGSFLFIQNTIVAANTTNDYDGETADLISSGNNVFGPATTNPITPGPADQLNVPTIDVALGPLQNNGGPTSTHALLAGSVALNAGNNTGAPATDQRGTGFVRVFDSTIDIGAFEAQDVTCGLTFTGILPAWLQEVGDCLQVKPNVFRGATKAEANATAQAMLDAFVDDALGSGDLTCTEETAETIECPVFDANFAATNCLAAVYVAATDTVWVARQANGINIIDPVTGVPTNVATGDVSQLMSSKFSGRVYYQDQALNEIHFADAEDGADLGLLVAGASLLPVFDETNVYVYVENSAGELAIYNANTSALISATADLSGVDFGCPAYYPGADRLYVGVDGVGVRIYNPLTGGLSSTITYDPAYEFFGAVYVPETDRIFVAAFNGTDDEVSIINPNTNTVVATIPLPGTVTSQPSSTFRSLNTGAICVFNTSGLTVINPVTEAIVCTVVLAGSFPSNLAFSPPAPDASTEPRIWLADQFDSQVETYEE